MSDSAHPVLEARELRRLLGRESFAAVENVSLTVEPGRIHALLGPNGAGKTTTVRMCATLLGPSSGTITVDGVDAVAHPDQARRRLGLMLGGDRGFYPRASVRDNLLFFADVHGITYRERRREVARVLDAVGLADVPTRQAGALSRGMLQRLHLARAILGSPRLLLLDEPTTGLDPDVALQVRDLVRDLAAQGIGVLLTSHSMPEVEELASEISLIGAGRIAARGSVADIAAYAGIALVTTMTLPASATDAAERLATHLPAAIDQRPISSNWALRISWPSSGSMTPAEADRALEAALAAENLARPSDLFTRPASLEDAYLAVADRLVR